MSGHKETLRWSGTGYYGYLNTENGYGGFDYKDHFLYMNESTWTAPGGWGYERRWCDSGYQNVLAAGGGTCLGWVYEDGLMESASKNSFTLESMIAASAWNKDAVWDVNSYTLNGHKLVLKASDRLTISQTAEKIDFAKFGHKGDFTDIAAVGFKLIDTGSYGNSCTYKGGHTGYVLCIDAMKVKVAKKGAAVMAMIGPDGHGHQQHIVAMLVGQAPHGPQAGGAAAAASTQPVHHLDGYHTQLLSLGHDQDLTARFDLPHPEHFGT
jgi:hypothetical protein